MDEFSEGIGRLCETMTAAMEWQQIRNAERRAAVLESKTDFIADGAWLCWTYDGLRLFLCESPVYQEGMKCQREQPDLYRQISIYCKVGRFNGYVRFPECPLRIPGIRDMVTYVPVHGGVTFFQDWWDGSVTYGFDTGHLVSTENIEIINDVDWMMAETESLARSLRIAARFEPYYLNARSNQRKAVVLDRMGKFLPLDIHGNLGAMLNLLCGEL